MTMDELVFTESSIFVDLKLNLQRGYVLNSQNAEIMVYTFYN